MAPFGGFDHNAQTFANADPAGAARYAAVRRPQPDMGDPGGRRQAQWPADRRPGAGTSGRLVPGPVAEVLRRHTTSNSTPGPAPKRRSQRCPTTSPTTVTTSTTGCAPGCSTVADLMPRCHWSARPSDEVDAGVSELDPPRLIHEGSPPNDRPHGRRRTRRNDARLAAQSKPVIGRRTTCAPDTGADRRVLGTHGASQEPRR